MRHLLFLVLCGFMPVSVFAQNPAPHTPQLPPEQPDITHVIVISIDGGRPDAILQVFRAFNWMDE